MKNIFKYTISVAVIFLVGCSITPSKYEKVVRKDGIYELKKESEKQSLKKIESWRFTDDLMYITVTITDFSGKELIKEVKHESSYSVVQGRNFGKVRYSVEENDVIYDLAVPINESGEIRGYTFKAD